MNTKQLMNLAAALAVTLTATLAGATGWSEMAELTASDAFDDDRHGWSVAVQGNLAVVGAPRTDGTNLQEGKAYLYQLNEASGGMTELAQLVWSSPSQADFLGWSVAMDGDVIVVGAYQNRNGGQGRALVFVKPEDGWGGIIEEEAVLWASNRGSGDYFGGAVAIEGETIVVGAYGEDTAGGQAGSAYVYTMPDSGWSGVLQEDAMLTPTTGGNTYLGYAVDIEGDVIVSGGYLATVNGVTYQGQGFVYVEPEDGWAGTMTETAALIASDGSGSDRMGHGIAISGGQVAVGAHQAEPPGSNTNHGAIYVFEEPVTGWSGTVNEIAQLHMSDPSNQSKFGWRVAMEGGTIVGASVVKEAVYVYQRPAGGWNGITTESQKIANPTGNGDDFGEGLAVTADYILVGSPYNDTGLPDAGRAFLYGPSVTAVRDAVPGLTRISLSAAPNPFNPRTVVSFELPTAGMTELTIYDVAGRRVRTFERGHRAAGRHTVTWDGFDDDGRSQPSGVYLARVMNSGTQGMVKLMLVR